MRHRPLLVLAALTILCSLPVAASAHEKESAYSSAFAGYFGDGDPVGMLGADGLAEPQPLNGTGENMRIVANVPLEGTVAGSDIELAGDYAYVGSYGEGMVIIDIKDPLNPKRAGVFPCGGGSQFDVQLQPGSDPKYAVLALESPTMNKECHKGNEGFVLVDITDKEKPKEVAFVGQKPEEGGVQDGAHNTTMDWPYLYVDQYQPTHGEQEGRNGQVDIFDLRRLIADPTDVQPLKVLPAEGGGFHDMQVDHRPDGKVIGYGASIGFTDQLDLKDPQKAEFIGRRFLAADHGVGISHGIEPNHDRTLAIESDEYAGGTGNGGCGGGDAEGTVPSGAVNVVSPGALHFLPLETEGEKAGQFKTTPGGGSIAQAGAFNIPAQTNPSPNEGCTAHVFWQAPDENRLVVAWYGRGTRIVDFTDPAKPVELGHYIPENTETWSAKPHKGYIFTGDTVRGMDVLEYTGEDCSRWPTTSGAAEVQRDRYQGSAFKIPESEGGLKPTDAVKSTPVGCGGKPVQQDGPGGPECQDDDPSPTLPDGGGTGGSSCEGGQQGGGQGGGGGQQGGGQQGGGQQGGGQQGGGQQGGQGPDGVQACTSSLGLGRTTARGGQKAGTVDFQFTRRVDAPVTVDIFRQSSGKRVTGEKLVKRFANQDGSFTWNGRDSSGRKVGNGFYFARFRIKAPNGKRDTVRVTLGRSDGRFGPRRSFYRRDSCGTLSKFKLSRPVFGGKDNRSLGIAYRLNQAARVAVTVTNRRGRVVERFDARDVQAGRTQRLTLAARGLERGDYRVKLSVTAGGRTTTSTLTANRL